MSDEKDVKVVGDYIIISEKTYSQGPRNPLDDDDYAGQLLGNFSQYRANWSSMGEKHEFRAARGNYDHNECLDSSDYIEDAALLVIAETSFDEALEAIEGDWEWTDEERADVPAFRAEVMRLFAQHVMDERSKSWPKIPSLMWDDIVAKAEALAIAAIEARTVGNKYAVPMSLSGGNWMKLEPDPGVEISTMELDGILWVPSKLMADDLDALPYPEAMQRAIAGAKTDGEAYADWASGNVWDIEVKVYKREFDEDEDEFSDDPDFYADNEFEPVFEDCSHECVGDDYADERLAQLLREAEQWVEEQEPGEVAPANATPSMSM